jgi:hypothetical protein
MQVSIELEKTIKLIITKHLNNILIEKIKRQTLLLEKPFYQNVHTSFMVHLPITFSACLQLYLLLQLLS